MNCLTGSRVGFGFRWRIFSALAWLGIAAATSATAQIPGSEPNGLVYFAGTVRTVIQGSAIVDLGDVHTLKVGEELAVFRTTDSYLRPLGTVRVSESHPDWLYTTAATSRDVRQGDLVMFVRTVKEMGTPDVYLNRFLALQHLKGKDRNSYSTVDHQSVSLALSDVAKHQPRWVREDRRIAGLVSGKSLDDAAESRLQFLTQQINQIRGLEEQGIPAAAAAGTEWQTVMTVLRGPSATIDIGDKPLTGGNNDSPASDQTEIEVIPVIKIRNAVARSLFDRPEEEQNSVSVIVTAMLRQQVGDEQLWLRRQLLESQFPMLANDDQIYFDVDKITRSLRSTD